LFQRLGDVHGEPSTAVVVFILAASYDNRLTVAKFSLVTSCDLWLSPVTGTPAAPAVRGCRPERRFQLFNCSRRSMYFCMASSAEVPLSFSQASYLARPTKSIMPGRFPLTSPAVACLNRAYNSSFISLEGLKSPSA